MLKRILKLLKGTKEQPPEQQTEQNSSPSTASTTLPAKPDAKAKSDLSSWGLLTGTYNPLPDDADDQSSVHKKDKNKN